MRAFEIAGYLRAGNVMRQYGLDEHAKSCFTMANELRAKK